MNESFEIAKKLAIGTASAAVVGGVSGAASGAIGSSICNLVQEGFSTRDAIQNGALGGVLVGGLVGGVLAAKGFFNGAPDKNFKNVANLSGGNLVKSVLAGMVGYGIIHRPEKVADFGQTATLFAVGGFFTMLPETFAVAYGAVPIISAKLLSNTQTKKLDRETRDLEKQSQTLKLN